MSILSPKEVKALGGLPSDGIAGMVEEAPPSAQNFRPNPRFVALMHRVIGKAGPTDPGLQAAAGAQGEGWVYVIDLRTPDGPQGRVPPEDIVGGFQVVDGQIVDDSYWANPGHKLFTENGLVVLPPTLKEAIIEELRRGAS